MILFLSASFLRNLHLVWKPDLKAFLIGDRNLFFLTPDSLMEVPEISPEAIDGFLKSNRITGSWQLLGYLAPNESPEMIGYAGVKTSGVEDPKDWTANMYLYTDSGIQPAAMQIRTSQVR
jgi:hypothetical protein